MLLCTCFFGFVCDVLCLDLCFHLLWWTKSSGSNLEITFSGKPFLAHCIRLGTPYLWPRGFYFPLPWHKKYCIILGYLAVSFTLSVNSVKIGTVTVMFITIPGTHSTWNKCRYSVNIVQKNEKEVPTAEFGYGHRCRSLAYTIAFIS